MGEAARDAEKMKSSNCSMFVIGSELVRSHRLASLQPCPSIPPNGVFSGKGSERSEEKSVSSWPLILRFWMPSNRDHAFSKVSPGIHVVNRSQSPLELISPWPLGAGKEGRHFCRYLRPWYSVRALVSSFVALTTCPSPTRTTLALEPHVWRTWPSRTRCTIVSESCSLQSPRRARNSADGPRMMAEGSVASSSKETLDVELLPGLATAERNTSVSHEKAV